jgi:small subunit ribosomal protein S20
MPVIKSAKKKARQAKAHEERNKGLRTRVKSTMKKMLVLSKTDVEGAKKFMPEAFSVIDTACKKHLLHKNTAARKKSLMARQIAGGKTVAAAEKKAPKAEKKVVAKEAK